MEKDWVKIYHSTSPHRIEIAKALLEDSDIQSVSMSKQDSMHLHLNERQPVELFVSNSDALQAKHLISKSLE